MAAAGCSSEPCLVTPILPTRDKKLFDHFVLLQHPLIDSNEEAKYNPKIFRKQLIDFFWKIKVYCTSVKSSVFGIIVKKIILENQGIL